MVFPNDPGSFEFWAERWDSPSAVDEKFQAFVMRTVLASVDYVDLSPFAAMFSGCQKNMEISIRLRMPFCRCAI